MSERRDPIVDARAMADAIGEAAPPVPTIELDLARDPAPRLTRFRLGQVPAHGWAPSMAIVGRRSVGKSSLAMALASFASTGAAHAVSCAVVPWGGTVIVHDAPGLRSAGSPGLRAHLADALRDDPPDVVLAAFSATEVDAGVDDDVDDLRALVRAWTPRRGAAPSLLVALHRVDELPPFDREAPADDPERLVAVETATRVLRARLSPLDGRCPIVATSATSDEAQPSGVGALADAARGLLASRAGTDAQRAGAFGRALERLGNRALTARWRALRDEARAIVLQPRGWTATTAGRSERG